MQDMRKTALSTEEVRDLQDLLQRTRLQGRDSRSKESQLVGPGKAIGEARADAGPLTERSKCKAFWAPRTLVGDKYSFLCKWGSPYYTRKEKRKMTMTDPIADMLTRIRNANSVGHESVDVPASKIKKSIAGILADEGYINGFDVIDDGKQGTIKINMKYGPDKEKVINGIKKISKPGLKVYAKASEVPRVLGGLGIAIISTSNGVISDKEARKLGVGGEVICYVW